VAGKSKDTPFYRSGPWRGTNVDPVRVEADQVLMSLNCEFVNGRIMRRGGRSLLANFEFIRPTKVLWYNGTTVSDVTDALIDGDLTTVGITNPWNAANSAIFVGFAHRVNAVKFHLTSAFAGGASTLTGRWFTRAGGAAGSFRVAGGTPTDGTASGGATMQVTGKFTFDATAEWFHATLPWDPGYDASAAAPEGDILLEQDLWWIKFTVSVISTGGNLSEIQGSLLGQVDSLPIIKTTGIGLTEFVTPDGARQIVMQYDFPGPYRDKWYMKTGETRYAALDLARQDHIPFRFPNSLKGSRPMLHTGTTVFNGWLIGATTEGKMWRYDGKTSAAMEAFQGLDAARGDPGARSYLASTPRGRFITPYRNRMVISGDPDAPLVFYVSLDDADISTIPPDAPVGGPNVWPLNGVVPVPGREGDAITGVSVIGDRLVIFTRRQIWVWDETSLRLAEGDIGCIAPFTIQRVGDNLMFLSHHGAFTFDGAVARESSKPMDHIFLHWVKWSRIEEAVSAHDRAKQEYWVYLPTHGRDKNRVALVYRYDNDSWRIATGWYPWDDETRKTVFGEPGDHTAVCSASQSDGREVVLFTQGEAELWQENTGFTDDGFIFPAYVLLTPFGDGETTFNFRTWRIGTEMDGALIEVWALLDGMMFEKEVHRMLDGLTATLTQAHVAKRSVTAVRKTFETAGSWDTDVEAYDKDEAVVFSMSGKAKRMQVAILLPGGQWDTTNLKFSRDFSTARGGIRDIQVDSAEQGAR